MAQLLQFCSDRTIRPSKDGQDDFIIFPFAVERLQIAPRIWHNIHENQGPPKKPSSATKSIPFN